MPLIVVTLISGVILPVLIVVVVFTCRRIGNRPARTGAHRTAPSQAAGSVEPDRIVRSHHVLSGRLMDAPTGRLWPSERHRVPPWLTASHQADPARTTLPMSGRFHP